MVASILLSPHDLEQISISALCKAHKRARKSAIQFVLLDNIHTYIKLEYGSM